MRETFASLKYPAYRIWFFSALIANIGTWMQRIAQDWLVLRTLTNDSAYAVGVVSALQFGPSLLFSPHAGVVADRVNPRKLLVCTQGLMGLISALLAVDVISGQVQLWHVYVAAALAGVVAAYDAPVRQTFVASMVPVGSLSNAVGLNATSFNAARLIGPAFAGLVINWVGEGWVFGINALTFLMPMAALILTPRRHFREVERSKPKPGQLREGVAYLRSRSDILVIMVVVAVVSAMTLNFPVTLAAMVRSTFHMEADAYGNVSSSFAIGSLTGALVAARRRDARVRLVIIGALGLGVATCILALMPNYYTFMAASIPVGFFVLSLLTAANQTVQLTTPEAVRGRVMSLYVMVLLGATPIGSPVVGWLSDAFGPRAALIAGGISSMTAALLVSLWAFKAWNIRLRYLRHAPFVETVRLRQGEADNENGLISPQDDQLKRC